MSRRHRDEPNENAIDRVPRWKEVRPKGWVLPKGWIAVRCPRKECERVTVVSRKLWVGDTVHTTRSCTYCFRIARLP